MKKRLWGALAAYVFAVLLGLIPQPLRAQSNVDQACKSQCIAQSCNSAMADPNNPLFNPTVFHACLNQCVVQCTTGPQTVLYPKFYILTILYAPPGCTSTPANPCGSTSAAVYANGSSTETKTSIEKSFTTSQSSTADASLTFPLDPSSASTGTLGISFGSTSDLSVTTTSGSSLTISKNKGLQWTAPGGLVDGVDHGLDRFRLLLNPAITLTRTANGTRWNMGFKGPTMIIAEVTACQIMHSCSPSSPIAPSIAQRLNLSDYCQILAQNPFVPHCSSTTVDFLGHPFTLPVLQGPFVPPKVDPAVTFPGRFVPTSWALPYAPPVSGICASNQASITNSFQATVTNTSTTQISYSTTTGFSLSLPIAGFGLKDTQTLTWTNTVSTENSKSGSQSATATIGCPSPDYDQSQGDLMAIYWDTIYGSFLFYPMTFTGQRLIHRGQVTDTSGKPVSHQPVTLTYGGKTYHTSTDNLGNYKIHSAVIAADRQHPLPAKVAVGGISINVTLGSTSAATVRIPSRAGGSPLKANQKTRAVE